MERKVVGEGPFSAIIPEGVRVGDEIHLSGAISVDQEGAPIHAGDFLAQNQVAYGHIETALEALGAGLGNVVKETVFVTDMSMPAGNEEAPFQEYGAMRDEIYGGTGNQVAQSLVEVAGLVMPDLLVEIEVLARYVQYPRHCLPPCGFAAAVLPAQLPVSAGSPRKRACSRSRAASFDGCP
jgi:enamine deaminase RidA (YjgF/YER057c/UK114 family)